MLADSRAEDFTHVAEYATDGFIASFAGQPAISLDPLFDTRHSIVRGQLVGP